MPISAKIIADSLNPHGSRLTTFVLEYPRFIHSELLTHKMLSKNAASSRAIPIEKMIEQVMENPAMPEWYGKNQSGMQAAEELSDEYCDATSYYQDLLTPKQRAKVYWLEARDEAIKQVTRLNKLGLHKQISNRILEPWFHIKVILSATEYENFFALRAHKDAQPEIQKLAYLMLDEYNASTPKSLKEGEWHIPFGDNIDEVRLRETFKQEFLGQDITMESQVQANKRKVAIARCARISFLNYEGKDDYAADIKLCDRLFGSNPKHLSPTEHVAVATNDKNFYGNFCGFKQFRKMFVEENLQDSRVIKKQYILN